MYIQTNNDSIANCCNGGKTIYEIGMKKTGLYYLIAQYLQMLSFKLLSVQAVLHYIVY